MRMHRMLARWWLAFWRWWLRRLRRSEVVGCSGAVVPSGWWSSSAGTAWWCRTDTPRQWRCHLRRQKHDFNQIGPGISISIQATRALFRLSDTVGGPRSSPPAVAAQSCDLRRSVYTFIDSNGRHLFRSSCELPVVAVAVVVERAAASGTTLVGELIGRDCDCLWNNMSMPESMRLFLRIVSAAWLLRRCDVVAPPSQPV